MWVFSPVHKQDVGWSGVGLPCFFTLIFVRGGGGGLMAIPTTLFHQYYNYCFVRCSIYAKLCKDEEPMVRRAACSNLKVGTKESRSYPLA